MCSNSFSFPIETKHDNQYIIHARYGLLCLAHVEAIEIRNLTVNEPRHFILDAADVNIHLELILGIKKYPTWN